MTTFWKNKKIIAYIALAHHTRFISPVIKNLVAQGAHAHYVVGQAERSQEITAIKLKLDYSHVFDYVSDQDKEDIEKNYVRLKHSFALNLKNNFLFGSSPTTVIDKTIYSSALEYIGFRNLLKKEKPDICFALHELNRWGKMFSFWAKKLDIPTITFQEGLYYGLDFGYTGHVQYSTLNLVWGNRIKKKLTDFEAPADKVIPVGNTHLAREIETQKKNSIRSKKRKQYNCEDAFAILLLFSGNIPDPEQLYPLFQVVSENPDIKLFIKFHPISKIDQVQKWVSSIPDKYNVKDTVFHEEEKVYDLMSLCDLCALVEPSTTGIEALAFGKPLVHLDIKMKQKDLPYSFTRFEVAAKMTPEQLGKALSQGDRLIFQPGKEKIESFFKEEIYDTGNAVTRVSHIAEKVVAANQEKKKNQIHAIAAPDKNWSIILLLRDDPDTMLKQLETIAVNSEDQGTFEVILIEPEDISKASSDILDTLEGNVTRLILDHGTALPGIMNRAAEKAAGQNLIFLRDCLLPMPGWLNQLEQASKKYGDNHIFGARILDSRGSLLHAGVVLDKNNAPVSAYKHLSPEFSPAMKERPFKMIDYFLSIDRNLFYEIGGFSEKSGQFSFMDLCLKASCNSESTMCIYLPKLCMISSVEDNGYFNADDSVYFFSRWHGTLWEDQARVYLSDNVSPEDIDAAKMAQSMAASNLTD